MLSVQAFKSLLPLAQNASICSKTTLVSFIWRGSQISSPLSKAITTVSRQQAAQCKALQGHVGLSGLQSSVPRNGHQVNSVRLYSILTQRLGNKAARLQGNALRVEQKASAGSKQSLSLGQSRRYSAWAPSFRGNDQTALYSLIALNCAVFFLWRGNIRFCYRQFTTSWDAIKAGRIHTLLTACFSQRDTWHLFSNMIGLFFFGRSAAYILGGRGLVALYLVGGIFGNIVYVTGQALQDSGSSDSYFSKPKSFFAASNTGIPALGASGAVNAVVIFDVLMMPWSQVLIYGIVPVPAIALGVMYVAYDVYGALGHGQSNVGYTAHLGGAAIGALACLGVRRGRFRRWSRLR